MTAANIGEVAAAIRTNRHTRRDSGLTFAGKGGWDDDLAKRRSTCHHCGCAMRFDGIIWLSNDEPDPQWQHRCRRASRATGQPMPHEPPPLSVKHQMRARLVDSVRERFADRSLTMLTMPGVLWPFEHTLLRRRGGQPTTFYAVERVEAIYRAACGALPGFEDGIDCLAAPAWATFAVRTSVVNGFYRGDVEDAIGSMPVDAAWIDLTGPVSALLVQKLVAAWHDRSIGSWLALTSLKARWTAQLSEQIGPVGLTAWLEAQLGPAKVVEYADPAPMHQAVWYRKP